MKYLLIMFTIMLLFVNCEKRVCKCELNPIIAHQNDSLIQDYELNKTVRDSRYNNYWKTLQEPRLQETGVETYRFSFIALLDHYQKVYRIQRVEDHFKLFVKEYAVSSFLRREDSLIRDTTRILTELEWQNIQQSMAENCFWTMPIQVKKRVLDGSSWTLEGFHPKGNACTKRDYYSAYRASPDSSRFRNICLQIMDLDSLKIRAFK